MKRIKISKLSILCLLLLLSCGKKTDLAEVPIGTVTSGTFYIDLHEEGEVEAINAINLSSPMISWRYGALKITQLVKDGMEVNVGDTVAVFDRGEVQKAIVEAEGRLEISMAELNKLKAQHESALEELKATYEVTKLSQEISKIQFESAVHESNIKKKEIQLTLEKADIALEQAKEQIENTIKIQREEVKQKQLSIAQDQAKLQEGHETMNKMVVVTSSPGIAIISKNYRTGNKFQAGDQVWAGTPLIQLPDMSSLKATVKINEVDIAKITKDLAVEIRPDAFSDSIFSGKIHSVANLAVNKEGSTKIKVFPVEIYMNGRHANLLPGMTVSCRILIDKIDSVLYVPLDAVHAEGDKLIVYKKTSRGYDKKEVETGVSNSDFIVILKGLEEKDKIALGNPFINKKEESNEKK
jgi:hypothetical protein